MINCASPRGADLGTVTVNLVGQAPSGAVYRLRHAVITVTGFGTATRVWNTEDDPDRTSLSDDVLAGDYAVSIAPGWSLERVEGGAAREVTAQLASDNPTFFIVAPQQRITVPLRFHVDTEVVDLSQGYDIVVTVEESTPQIIVVTNLHNFQTGSVTVYPGDANGDVAPLRTIAGPLTTLKSPGGVTVTDDEIVVCDSSAISFFPINANGNVAPTRQITGFESRVSAPIDVAVYNGEVYVIQIDELLVFPITANGDASPTRRIRGFSFGEFLSIDHGELYVSDRGAGKVVVYSLPLAEDAQPTRVLPVQCVSGIAVGDGELFLNRDCIQLTGIDVYPDTASGSVPPLRSLAGDLTGMEAPEQIKLFQHELYVADIEVDQVFVYPGSASGNVTPTRTIAGPHTGLFTVIGVAVR